MTSRRWVPAGRPSVPVRPMSWSWAAGEHGTRYVLVTGVMLPGKTSEQWIDNVLASAQGAITGEKFERFEASFVGAGDTLSAAVGEALAVLDQSLDAGFRPGMGNVIPDRFFWALPPGEEGELLEGEEGLLPGDEPDGMGDAKGSPRRVH